MQTSTVNNLPIYYTGKVNTVTNPNITVTSDAQFSSLPDTYEFSTKTSAKSDLQSEFEKVQSQQGLIGKAWNGIKNLLHMKSGSNHVEEVIKKAEAGEISQEEATAALDKYKAGQKMCVDVAADMLSGILAVGAFALAVPTGGASLAVGLGLATLTGTAVKIGVKAGDAIATGKEYTKKDLLYDAATGAINGIMSPVSNGIGASVTKTIGEKFGLKIIQEGAETVIEQGVKQGLKTAIIQQSVDVAGGTILQRAVALGTGMAVDGALSGASDNMVRAAFNGDNVLEAGLQGAVGGAIAAPIIGGGFRMASKAGRAINNKMTLRKVLPDGIDTKFAQGEVGDCSLLSTLDGLMNNPNTQKNIKKSITKTWGGDYNVRIGDRVVRVAKSSLTDEMLSDNTGIRLFEQAYKQISGDLDGGFAEVVAKQFGLNPVHITSDAITDEMLDRLAKQQDDLVLSLGANIDSDGAISILGDSRHYFTIKNIDADSKVIKLTSPIDTSKTIELSYDEFKLLGISVDGGSIKATDLPNVARGLDDELFRGLRTDDSQRLILSRLNCSEDTFNEMLSQLDVSSRQISLDELTTYLKANDLSVDDFVSLVQKHLDGTQFDEFGDIALVDVLQAVSSHKTLQNSSFFDGFKLTLADTDEIVSAVKAGNYERIYEILQVRNPQLAESLFDADVFGNGTNINTLFEMINNTIVPMNADDVVNLGIINGQEKIVLFRNAVSIPQQSGHVMKANDLIKSNMMTSDLVDICLDNNVAVPRFKTTKIKPTTSTTIPFEIDVQDIMQRARANGIDSLSSHEIHALTDCFSEMYDGDKLFRKLVDKNIKTNSSKYSRIYDLVEYLKMSAAPVLKGTNVQIEDHAFMRMIDRNMLSVLDNGQMQYLSFEDFIRVLAENAKKNNSVLDGYQGSSGIKLILNKGDNGRIIIDSIM